MTEPISPAEPVLARASLADWLAVAAGTLGAVMALIDVSIVNSSLPVIQGEIGATASEGTWIGTAYLVAEIVVIPLTAWLERLLGQRRLLLGGAAIFTLFSVLCGMAPNLMTIVLGRIGQGLAGGVLIPTALTIVARRLPPSQQPVGLAIVAMAVLLGPIAGPILGGWLTENYSWHLAFFINVPICLCQGILLMIAIPKSEGDWHELRQADWLGIIGMVVGLGAATTFLEEGHREQWFESPLIWQLAVAGVVGFGLVAAGQFRRGRPIIRLSLLGNWSLASAVLLMTVVGTLLYSCLFITPQFLVAVAGYNALQAGQVAAFAGVMSFPAAILYTPLSARVDTRIIIASAMLCIAIAAYMASRLTVQSTGGDFTGTQVLFGVGTMLASIPLQQAVLGSVSIDDAPEANSLISVTRNLGGSIGLAAIASFQDQRLDLHHWQLSAALAANDIEVQQRVADAATLFGNGAEGLEAAYRAFDGAFVTQALVMTFNDMFLTLSMIGLAVAPLAVFLPAAKPGQSPAAMH